MAKELDQELQGFLEDTEEDSSLGGLRKAVDGLQNVLKSIVGHPGAKVKTASAPDPNPNAEDDADNPVQTGDVTEEEPVDEDEAKIKKQRKRARAGAGRLGKGMSAPPPSDDEEEEEDEEDAQQKPRYETDPDMDNEDDEDDEDAQDEGANPPAENDDADDEDAEQAQPVPGKKPAAKPMLPAQKSDATVTEENITKSQLEDEDGDGYFEVVEASEALYTLDRTLKKSLAAISEQIAAVAERLTTLEDASAVLMKSQAYVVKSMAEDAAVPAKQTATGQLIDLKGEMPEHTKLNKSQNGAKKAITKAGVPTNKSDVKDVIMALVANKSMSVRRLQTFDRYDLPSFWETLQPEERTQITEGLAALSS